MAERRESPILEFLRSSKGVTAILLLAAASMFPTWTVDRSRPAVKPLSFDPIGESQSGQAVRARLWQDPLAAAYRDASSRSENGPSDEERISRRADLHRLLVEGHVDNERQLILPVVLAGGGNPADRENRLRYRYAVVSALGVAGYVPEDGQRIGYVYPELELGESVRPGALAGKPPFRTGHADPPRPEASPVPYEFFTRSGNAPVGASDSSHWSRVLVLWIDGDVMRLDPAEKLLSIPYDLVEGIHGKTADDSCTLAGDVDLRCLWTTGSTSLIGLLKDWIEVVSEKAPMLMHLPDVFGEDRKQAFSIYATSATVPGSTIKERLGDGSSVFVDGLENAPDEWKRARYELKRGGLGENTVPIGEVIRTIGDDTELIGTIRSELKTRGLENKRFAVFAEWDTDYGRNWKSAFRTVFDSKAAKEAAKEAKEKNRKVVPVRWTIDHQSYLNGLDGRIPGEDASGTGAADPGRPETFQAYGTERTDYVARLLTRLRDPPREEKGRRADEGDDTLAAIGVLGSDVHDKLFLLSVLRREFPSAVFFTTDMDARFLDPAGIEYLRNLVIVSHYGLDLDPKLQEDIPPFRSGYQSALFHGTLNALGHAPAADFAPQDPRVYEVGLSGLYDLSPISETGSGSTKEPTLAPVRDNLLESLGAKHIWLVVLGALCGLSLLVSVGRGAVPSVRMSRKARKQLRWTFGTFFVLMTACAVVYLVQAGESDREPFAWADGVSVWPSELIRIVVASLALGWQYRVLRDLRGQLPRVEQDLGIRSSPRSAKEKRKKKDRDVTAETTSIQELPATGVPPFPGVSVTTDARLGAIREGDGSPAEWISEPTKLSWSGMPWARPYKQTLRVVDVADDFLMLAADRYRCRRALVHLLLFMVLAVSMTTAFGRPISPARGGGAFWLDKGILLVSVLSMQWLIFLVLDSGMIVARFIQRLGREDIVDPDRQVYKKTAREKLIKDELVWARRRVEATANLTARVGGFVYYPSVVILLMIIARLPVFDAWVWAPSLVVVILLSISMVVVCYMLMWTAARRLRRDVIASLLDERARSFGDEKTRQAIDEYVADVKELKKGAFAPFWEHPLLRAILIPFAGLGSLSLLQYLG